MANPLKLSTSAKQGQGENRAKQATKLANTQTNTQQTQTINQPKNTNKQTRKQAKKKASKQAKLAHAACWIWSPSKAADFPGTSPQLAAGEPRFAGKAPSPPQKAPECGTSSCQTKQDMVPKNQKKKRRPGSMSKRSTHYPAKVEATKPLRHATGVIVKRTSRATSAIERIGNDSNKSNA